MPKRQFDFEYLANVVGRFLRQSTVTAIEPYGNGAINDTFKVAAAGKYYLLQRINSQYFPDPVALMDNFKKIAACQGRQLGLSAVRLMLGNGLWFRDEAGDYWRLYDFFEHSYSCQRLDNNFQAYEIAKAYGQYLACLATLPLTALQVVVHNFHNTVSRYGQLLQAEKFDRFNRVRDCLNELDFVKTRLDEILEFSNLLDSGQIPKRLTHNDTGIDNVLLDVSTGAALAVIDWDTTMPGYSLWDFGDLFRSALGIEFDERISPKECFNALLSGYLAGSGKLLLPVEISNFAFAGRIISLELGIRYLTDYLSGDPVFKYSDGASLLRARKSFSRYRIMNHHRQQFAELTAQALLVYER